MAALVDLKGRRFGDWEVLRKGETVITANGSRSVMWICRCECGVEQPVHGGNLRNGFSTKCGPCARNHKISVAPGTKFERWEVLREVEPHVYKNGIDKRITYLCRCECGRTGEVMINNLRNGKSTQCKACARNSPAHRIRPYEALFNRARDCAAKSRRPWHLSYEDFLSIVATGECHYCWLPLTFADYATNRKSGAYQIDRKDNALGYVSGNVVACCKTCNYAKGKRYTYEQWYGMTAYQRAQRAQEREVKASAAGASNA